MENRIMEQFKGFLAASPLWEGAGPFGIEQFRIPLVPTSLSQGKEILRNLPSLSRNSILGKRMESFFSYLIRSDPGYDLLAENLQIFRDKITIGELDFIVKDKETGRALHIELVYKFYVYDPSYTIEEERWIGPNRKDTLLQKIQKLKDHQFPLIYAEEATLALGELNIDNRKLKQKICFMANLFVPREMKGQNFPLINNSCICGYWLGLDKFNSQEFLQNMFFAPKKPDWPIDPEANKEWHPFDTIYTKVEEFHKNKISPLLWMKTSTGVVERFFVVWW